jgi:hypothetical protein
LTNPWTIAVVTRDVLLINAMITMLVLNVEMGDVGLLFGRIGFVWRSHRQSRHVSAAAAAAAATTTPGKA